MDVRAVAGHSGMDMPHAGSGHSGHHDIDMGNQCSMNMLFTWSTHNLCIVFPSWRITGTGNLILSLLAIALLTAGYEAVRDLARRYENATTPVPWTKPSDDEVRSGRSSPPVMTAARARGRKTVKAALYAVQVFYSFFIMLLFMTYNGWVMLSVAAGAFLGYMVFGGATGSVRTVACH